MNNIMSIIFAFDNENENKLNELTLHRTTASLPFGGRYRFIDFALSNLVNSQITTIGIVTNKNYFSLLDHIRMGRDWDLNRKNGGIVVFPPYVSSSIKSLYSGKIEALISTGGYLKHNKEEYVILSNSNVAINIDYDDVYETHLKSGADITMITCDGTLGSARRVVVGSGEDGAVKDICIKSDSSDEQVYELGLNIYLLKKDLLIKAVEDNYAHGNLDFERHILQANVNRLKIVAYKHHGYSAIIDSIKTYFNESMRLLDAGVRKDLFYRAGKIFTKVKDSVPTVYKSQATVKNSLVADGCVINGVVENSILFRGVVVEEGAVIKNSIVMENGHVMKYSKLSHVITDKDVKITQSRNISGYASYPIVIVKGKEI